MLQIDFEAGKTQLKYHTKNPVYQYLVNKFNENVEAYFLELKNRMPSSGKIIEIGVGEGQISERCLLAFPNSEYRCVDIANGILNIARRNLIGRYANVSFDIEDVTALTYEDKSFDLVVCCEVLEHVEEYTKGLQEIHRVLKPGAYALLSVPNEPLWRCCNMLRGYYWSALGNTPGHVNNWSGRQFLKLLQDNGFTTLSKKNPIPWSVFLCQKSEAIQG